MTSALISFEALAREIERLFPPNSRQLAVLGPPLGELRRTLETAGGDAKPLLDLVEDLLEAQLRELGWPAAMR